MHSGADLDPIWKRSPLLGARKLAPKKPFSCEKQTCICYKKTFIYIKVNLKGLKESHFKLFLALALASGATRARLGVSEHPPNPHFQGLKIDLCGYRCRNYFSRLAPGLSGDVVREILVRVGIFSSSGENLLRSDFHHSNLFQS